MKTIEEIKGRCYIDSEGHWHWRGSKRHDGRANIYAPDFTRGGMKVQFGARAVYHLTKKKPIPEGWRVFGCTEYMDCVNPACVVCESDEAHGERLKAEGTQKGLMSRILANRKINRGRTVITPALVLEIQASPETGLAIAARTGICRSTVSRIRRGKFTSVQAAGMFSGLIQGGRNA